VKESENSLRLFLTGFSAASIAEPLLSLDETADSAAIDSAMQTGGVEIIGIRKAGVLNGWVLRDDLGPRWSAACVRAFDAQAVVADTVALHEVVQGLNRFPYLFVRSFGQVGGVIRRSDIQKPPMRMWLFGLVTISELRVTRMIDEVCPHDAWRQYLSAGRIDKAKSLRAERRRRGQEPSLLDCLQFADKGRIVARDDGLRQLTRFASRGEVDRFVAALQDLRNNLAHSQDISGDWDVIFELATNLYRIVLGPVINSDSQTAIDVASPEVTRIVDAVCNERCESMKNSERPIPE